MGKAQHKEVRIPSAKPQPSLRPATSDSRESSHQARSYSSSSQSSLHRLATSPLLKHPALGFSSLFPEKTGAQLILCSNLFQGGQGTQLCLLLQDWAVSVDLS